MVAFGNFSVSGMVMALVSSAMLVFLWLTYSAGAKLAVFTRQGAVCYSVCAGFPWWMRCTELFQLDPHDVHRGPTHS
jgi:hypothetical protein